MARHDPARERVVAVERDARAAQLLGRRRHRPGGDEQVGAVDRRPSSSPGTGAASGSIGAPASRLRVYGRPHTKSSAGGPAHDRRQIGERGLAQRLELTSGLDGQLGRHRLVVGSRGLAEEAVDGERRHGPQGSAGRRLARRVDAHVHVVVVADERLDDTAGPVQREVRADEHELGIGCEEEVEQVLRERDVDLLDGRRRDLALVVARVVDVDVETVLVRGVLVERAAAVAADVADHEAGGSRGCSSW